MRWNCPHCGVNLGIADDKMTTSWSFSRCYQCGGYALVRKSEVNIIKVDRVPPGEKIILPDSAENPLLSETATRNLNRLMQNNTAQASATSSPALNAQAASATGANTANAAAIKPVVKPATRRNTASGMTNPLHAAQSAPSAPLAQAGMENISANALSAMDVPSDKLSYAQPFAPVSQDASARPLAGPHAPAGASVDRSAMPAYMNGVNGMNGGLFPEPLPEVPATSGRIRLLPLAIGIAAAFAVGSGLYLLMQSGEIIEKTRPTLSNHRQAPSASSALSGDDNEIASIHTSRAAKNLTVAKVEQAQPPSHSIGNYPNPNNYTDQVRSQAMAPDRQQLIPTAPKPVQLSSDNPPLLVQPKAKNIHLRSGPGMIYPVVGNADEKAKYVVTDWNDRWFKVLPQAGANAAQNGAQNGTEIAGWIRTDSVQVVPASNNGTL
jgi:hypothetical protein